MDSIPLKDKLLSLYKQYKYALLILLIGIILINIPTAPKTASGGKSNNTPEKTACKDSLTIELETILEQISGVGNAEVLLTLGRGPTVRYQENMDQTTGENSQSIRKETVMITDEHRNETGLVISRDSEVYRGAVIICQGADKPSVRLSIIDAVSKVTGLSSDRICVLKMN